MSQATPRNVVQMPNAQTRPTIDEMTVNLLAKGQPIQAQQQQPQLTQSIQQTEIMQPEQPGPVDNLFEGLGSGAKAVLKGFGDFVNTQKETPEGRLLLTNLLAGVTVGLGADPIIGANIVQQGQEQFRLGLAKQQKDIQLQQKAEIEQQKAAADAEQKQIERDQKLLDEQRKRQEKIEDALYLDRMKKEQDPKEARFNARTEASHSILSKFETEKNPYYKDTVKFYKDTNVPYLFKSDKFKQIEQAQRDFINAALRRESGAAIAESEFENARLQYFPQPGDTPEVVKQKQKNREMQFEKIEELKQRDPLGIL